MAMTVKTCGIDVTVQEVSVHAKNDSFLQMEVRLTVLNGAYKDFPFNDFGACNADALGIWLRTHGGALSETTKAVLQSEAQQPQPRASWLKRQWRKLRRKAQ